MHEAGHDVLCVGHASYDLVFSVAKHPAADEKTLADNLLACGGGPAANAAVTVARLGYRSAFAGYLGNDLYGEKHWQELESEAVATDFIIRGSSPTPLSTVLVKPDGARALINFKGNTQALPANAIDFAALACKVVLFDGHEPDISVPLVELAQSWNIPTVLDAGSLHTGTSNLMYQVDYLVCSEKFALQVANNVESALKEMSVHSPHVVITLGEKGLIWQCGNDHGHLTAFPVTALDTTGAGDAFHGAFAAAVAAKMGWQQTLRYASAAGAWCCTKMGARPGMPDKLALQTFLQQYPELGT